MTTLAQTVKTTIETITPDTFSLYAGYGMVDGKYVRYPVAVKEKEKRNDKGRVIFSVYRYADDSTLTYRYNAKNETYTLKADKGGIEP